MAMRLRAEHRGGVGGDRYGLNTSRGGRGSAASGDHKSDLMTASIGDHLPEREQAVALPVASLAPG